MVMASAIALVCSCGKKTVTAVSDFVICVFREAGRVVLECRKVVREVGRAFDDDGTEPANEFRALCAELSPLITSKTEELLADG
jgi:hypothetical protein